MKATQTPLRMTLKRYDSLIHAADPAALRLLACDLAAAVLPIFGAEYPEDHRPLMALEVARRYAAGVATETERLGASAVMVALCRDLEDDRPWSTLQAAANAAAFTLCKDARFGFRHALEWIADARGEQYRDPATYAQYFAPLEALQRA